MSVKVKQRKGKWWLFIDYKGRRKAKCVGTDKRAADAAAAKIAARLALGEFDMTADDKPRRPFDAYYLAWMDAYARIHCKSSTCEQYEAVYRNHLLPHFGKRDIADIKREDVKALIAVVAQGRARGTVKRVLAPFREMFNHAVEDGHVPTNPASKIFRRTRLDAGTKRAPDNLTREELKVLLDLFRTHEPESYAFALVLARTGMRLGEAAALQWDDIDWHGCFADVQRSYSKRCLSTPKSGKGRRVDLSDHLVEVLTLRHVAAKKNALRSGTPVSPWVFPGEDDPAHPLDVDNFRRRQWARMVKKAGLNRRRIHALRHTYASLLIAQAESLAYVRDQLGHHSIQITVDTYGHLVPGGNRAAVNRLDDEPAASVTVTPHATN